MAATKIQSRSFSDALSTKGADAHWSMKLLTMLLLVSWLALDAPPAWAGDLGVYPAPAGEQGELARLDSICSPAFALPSNR